MIISLMFALQKTSLSSLTPFAFIRLRTLCLNHPGGVCAPILSEARKQSFPSLINQRLAVDPLLSSLGTVFIPIPPVTLLSTAFTHFHPGGGIALARQVPLE